MTPSAGVLVRLPVLLVDHFPSWYRCWYRSVVCAQCPYYSSLICASGSTVCDSQSWL